MRRLEILIEISTFSSEAGFDKHIQPIQLIVAQYYDFSWSSPTRQSNRVSQADYRQIKNKPLSDIEFRPMQALTPGNGTPHTTKKE